MITLEQLKTRLGIITNSFPMASDENIFQEMKRLCEERGLDPRGFYCVSRKVLCNRVAHVTVYKQGESEKQDNAIFKFTFNQPLFDNWKSSLAKEKDVFKHKLLWTDGAEVLSTLSDKKFLSETHKIILELSLKHGYNLKSFVADAQKEYQPVGGMSRTWENYFKLTNWLFYSEFPSLETRKIF